MPQTEIIFKVKQYVDHRALVFNFFECQDFKQLY